MNDSFIKLNNEVYLVLISVPGTATIRGKTQMVVSDWHLDLQKSRERRFALMFSRFKKKKRIAAIELNDYYIRVLHYIEGDIASASIYEAPLPKGIVEEEIVQDEMAFYDLLKDLVKKWGIANDDLYFFVPDHAVLMRVFNYPVDLKNEKLKGYVEMEIGESIHLPFESPLIDVDTKGMQDGEAVLFAVPAEEITTLMRLYEDVRLEPVHLGIRALANLRFLAVTNYLNLNRTYLIVDWSVEAASMSIYSDGKVDFLRYQSIETPRDAWQYVEVDENNYRFVYDGDRDLYQRLLIDQGYEIERILNFYRFSLHKGEKSVDEIIMMGDHPEMETIVREVRNIIDSPVVVIDDAHVKSHYPNFGAKHTALIGLALKGAQSNDS